MPARPLDPQHHGSDTTTRHVRVQVRPQFVPDEDLDPDAPHLSLGDQWKGKRYIFAYHITITNQGERTVQLLRRRWHIIDADGDTHDVEGDGVIGRQPTLKPGQAFEYASYCPLPTPWGTMEGAYTFVENGTREEFQVAVGRFYLVSG
ncbi:MAG TPA: Co2+/Mg2+ efflux protein ApaG [Phycisphaerales bacterium]|nr:Co2+/Mg2+ efflux protein ApaG [Phycisphaerales bacterium]